jgi:3-deoxy-manno-octulosonate cytidylyltransferase (CMP-KDO synthetase)
MNSKIKIIGVIPAHLDSVRFKRKILHKIFGLPMIEHVRRRVLKTKILDEVFVASGDDEILNLIKNYGGNTIKTSKTHHNGTSRVAESIRKKDCTHVLIIQGDEPLIQFNHLNNMVNAIKQNPERDSWNSTCNLDNPESLNAKNVVKASLNFENRILYCFRKSPSICTIKDQLIYIKKIQGLIGFRKEILLKISSLVSSNFESLESIEQLKIISNGFNLYSVSQSNEVPSINEEKDLNDLYSYLEKNKDEFEITNQILKNKY